jgi:transcriptional regulator with XRE-family HTH domain
MSVSPALPPNPQVQRAFCTRLKAEREKRGIGLDAIADATKVKLSLLASLERGDLSRWPHGIYRRSFFKAYVRAIGLPTEPSFSDFLEFFPEEPTSQGTAPAALHADASARLRLTLVASPWRPPSTRYLLAAMLDAVAVLGAAAAVSWLIGGRLWTCTGVIALVYSAITTACLGRSAALALLTRRRSPPASGGGLRDAEPVRGRLDVIRAWLPGASRQAEDAAQDVLT